MMQFEGTQNVAGKRHKIGGWWEERSLPQKILLGIGFGILGIGFLFLCGWIVMLLWNWLMPDIFGLKVISYWQAWGLMILSSILFKGMGPNGYNGSSEKKRRRKLQRFIQEDAATKKDSEE